MELSQLSLPQLTELAQDLRQEIIQTSLKNGGHLGASLGTVELAIALHRSFESPREPIVWDVGHQAYAHKLLTGRRENFGSLRKTGGISGFLSRTESPHDVFGAGHSSTALSAALAMAWVRGRPEAPGDGSWTVAVVGDGGLTAGLALEALNNLKSLPVGPLLIVLNDNQMSISPNVGAIPAILASGGGSEFFDHFGIDYVGPVDGHDLSALLGVFQGIKQAGSPRRPVLLHALTQKGKGYAPAEERPDTFHGVSPIRQKIPDTDVSLPVNPTFSEAFGKAMIEVAREDSRLVAITAAMTEGTGLGSFAEEFSGRFFDVGIAEPHGVTFAAGLATQGLRPVVAIYSTFLQRGLDGIIHDVALQKLPVIFALDRAGLVGADGPTHHGVFDLVYLSMIPGISVYSPACLDDVALVLRECLGLSGPSAIRYPRGSGKLKLETPLQDGMRWHQRAARPELITVAVGTMAARLAEVVQSLDPSAQKISAVSVVRVKPLPASFLDLAKQNPQARWLILEEGQIKGGFGEHLVSQACAQLGRADLIGLGDAFVEHGSISDLEKSQGLDPASLRLRIKSLLGLST